ncbi:DNA methyltransferase [Piscibacillus halophilus]|uniref:DNA methyltransferase n=1 Tax=Piscibacillus halophilus TaxID=571933 RepID=UPI00158C3DE4|nr:DNA methyltransferase [Piscibacillus halophilus]
MRQLLGTNKVLAYLTMMAPRLLELYRVLKKDGVLFLHCDPTASHYLKLLLDAVFGYKNFKNEIIWCYRQGGRGNKYFPKKHDTIFFYTKGESYTFNADSIRIPYHGTGGYQTSGKGVTNKNGKTYKPNEKGKIPEDWWDIPALAPMSKERVGYPTQKPLALLDRIIKVGSNEGDLVLDPFCGCGSAIVSAQNNNRKWIGIDVTHIAITTIKERLNNNFNLLNDYTVHGEPIDIEGAIELSQNNRFQFQIWALSLIGINYADDYNSIKKGPDGGVDGVRYFEKGNGVLSKAIIQVKSGKVGVKDIREFNAVIEKENAAIGVFITLKTPTKNMVSEAAGAGTFNHVDGKIYPKISIVTIEDLLKHSHLHNAIFP